MEMPEFEVEPMLRSRDIVGQFRERKRPERQSHPTHDYHPGECTLTSDKGKKCQTFSIEQRTFQCNTVNFKAP